MFSKELLEFIDKVDLKLSEKYTSDFDKEKGILARAVKMNEEVGELCNEVLSYTNDQRQEKLSKHNEDTLGSEFADVIFTTLLLAKSMDVDMEVAINKKMKKVKKRFEIK